MKKRWLLGMMCLLFVNSLFAVVVSTIEQLDTLARDNGGFSFSAFGDNNGYAKSNYTSGDNNAKGMAGLEDWVKAKDKFIVAVGDHAIGTRLNWYKMNETDAFFHNNYYPSLGDNCNGTSYFYGVTGDQAVWGRGWVMFKALNNFFTRNTSVDQITFRPKGTAKVYSSKSKTEPNVLVPYDDQLCDYYAKRKQGNFTFHILSVNCPDPGVLASVSKNFLISKLNTLAATKTDHDVIIVMAQKANWVQRAEDSKWISRTERDTIMTVADLVLCGDDHVYRRQSNFDGQYDGTEALWMNVGQPCATTGSGRGYLNFHMFDNPPRFTVQYILSEAASRTLHVAARQIGTLQKSLPAAHTKPYLKYINGPFVSVDWNNFPITTSTTTVPSVSLAVPSANVTVNAGTNLYVKVNATDPDGISQVRLYKNGVKLARTEGGAPYEWGLATQNDPELKNLAAGSFVLTAEATDTKGTIGKTTASITVTVKSANQAPYFTSNPFSLADASLGAAYNQSFGAKAIDPEGGTKTFSKVSGPVWLSVSSAGSATGTPGTVDVGTNSFMVKVTDVGGLSATATMTIKVTASTTTVPWVTNMTEVAAGTAITNAGLKVGSVSREYHATIAAGKVFSQTPGGNTSAAIGSSVALAVSLGPQTVPSVGSIITLKAVNGKYVSATYSTNNTLIASKTTLSNYERFKVVNATNSVALQCMGNNKFVSIDVLNGSKPMVANRAGIGSYEKFQMVQSGSQIAIKSVTSTNYASAISGGAAPLQANQTYIGSYEKYTWKVE